MIMKREEFDALVNRNKELCICGHTRFIHSIDDEGRESTWCSKPECPCRKFRSSLSESKTPSEKP